MKMEETKSVNSTSSQGNKSNVGANRNTIDKQNVNSECTNVKTLPEYETMAKHLQGSEMSNIEDNKKNEDVDDGVNINLHVIEERRKQNNEELYSDSVSGERELSKDDGSFYRNRTSEIVENKSADNQNTIGEFLIQLEDSVNGDKTEKPAAMSELHNLLKDEEKCKKSSIFPAHSRGDGGNDGDHDTGDEKSLKLSCEASGTNVITETDDIKVDDALSVTTQLTVSEDQLPDSVKNGNKSKSRQKCKKQRKWKVPPPEDYRGFAGKDDMLSNFYPCDLYVYGKRFRSTEQAYQWRKAIFMKNKKAADEILAAEHANEAKFIANKYFRGADLSAWIPCRVPVMRQLLRAKARCCEAFREELCKTGDRFIAEVVPRDKFWAIADGTGKNVMGYLLMELRSSLDDAINADPDEDGQMIDFPGDDTSDSYAAYNPNKRTFMLIGNSEIDDINCEDFGQAINLNKVVRESFEDAQNFIRDENLVKCSPIVIHLMSYETISKHHVDVTVKGVCQIIEEIQRKTENADVILSLPVYPSLSCDSKPSKQATAISAQLFRTFKGKSKVCCLRNAVKLSEEECFRDDGTLSNKAQELLKMNLLSTVNYHLFGTKHPKRKTSQLSQRSRKLDSRWKKSTAQNDQTKISQLQDTKKYKWLFIKTKRLCYLLICCIVVIVAYLISHVISWYN